MGVQERRQRERQARRSAVLDAARLLVRERGYNGTTTRQIAEACELSEATLFFYFSSKDEIFTSLLFEGIDFMQTRIDTIAADDPDLEDLLTRLWTLFGELHDEHPEYFQVFAALANPESTAAISSEVRDEIATRSGDNFRRVADLLARHLPSTEARVTTDLLWAAFLGLALLRDTRVNLGAAAHPTAEELRAAYELLLSSLGRESKA